MLEAELGKDECCGVALNWQKVSLSQFTLFGATCDICKTSYENKSNSDVIYMGEFNEGYRCCNCGKDIEGKDITYFNDYGPHYFDELNDSSNIIPFCPNCEFEPMNSWEIN